MKNLNYILLFFACIAFVACTDSVGSSGNTSVTEPATAVAEKGAGFFERIFNKSKPTSLAMMDYIHWVENPENGLRKSKMYGDYEFTVQHLPLAYRALQSLKKETINTATLEAEKLELQDLDYYTFTIATSGREQDILKANISGNEEFQNRINYFSFGMQNDLMLVDGADTLRCGMYHFERTYGVTPYKKFVVAFPKKHQSAKAKQQDKVFVYYDRFFGTGPIKFTISSNDLEDLPKLALK